MIGFIEKNISSYWLKTINNWIENLSKKDSKWNADEKLIMHEDTIDYSYLKSVVHRDSANKDASLHHWWIICGWI
jgi:hypothetical protein